MSGLAGRRRRQLVALPSLVLSIALLPGPVARAAFEWEHVTPRSLVVGESPLRWPASGGDRGLRLDLAGGRPWRWPGVGVAAIRLGFAGRRRALGVSLSELEGPAYRESRLTAGFEDVLVRQRLGIGASLLVVSAGETAVRSLTGAELDLAWEFRLSQLVLAARAAGALQSRGASRLGVPQTLAISARAMAPGLVAGLQIQEGSLGRRLRLGLLIEALEPVAIGAAWSSVGSPIGLAIRLRWRGFTFGSGWSWHPDLPASQLASLSLVPGAGRRSGEAR